MHQDTVSSRCPTCPSPLPNKKESGRFKIISCAKREGFVIKIVGTWTSSSRTGFFSDRHELLFREMKPHPVEDPANNPEC